MDNNDPNIPWAGGTSSAFINDNLNESATEEKRKQKQQRSDLLPVASDLLKILEKEKASVMAVDSFPLDKIEDAQKLLDELRARQLYLTFIGRLEGWILTRLQKTPVPRKRPS
jgi:hypothetical protein